MNILTAPFRWVKSLVVAAVGTAVTTAVIDAIAIAVILFVLYLTRRIWFPLIKKWL